MVRADCAVWTLELLAKPPFASFAGLRSLTLMPFFVAAFFCVAILTFSSVGCLCGVSDTKQQLTAAFDVPFRDQVIEADQLFLNTLLLRSFWLFRQRVFLVLWCTHFGFPDQYPCQCSREPLILA